MLKRQKTRVHVPLPRHLFALARPNYIILQKSCANRYPHKATPSISNNIFTIEDFTSFDFIDRVIAYYEPQCIDEHPSLERLLQINEKIEYWATKMMGPLIQYKENFVKEIFRLYMEDYSKEDRKPIMQEIRRCHKSIDSTGLVNPVLIENLARLLDKYKRMISAKPRAYTPADSAAKMDENLEKIYILLEEKLQRDQKISDREFRLLIKENIQLKLNYQAHDFPLDDNSVAEIVIKRKKVFQSVAFEHMKQTFLLLVTLAENTALRYDIFNMNTGNQVSSTMAFPYQQSSLESLERLGIVYSKTIGCILMEDPEKDVISLYLPSAKRITKILSIRRHFGGMQRSKKMVFEVLDNHCAIARAYGEELRIDHLLNGGNICSHTLPGKVTNIKYIEDLDYLVITDIEDITVYEVQYEGVRLKRKYKYKYDDLDTSLVGLFRTGNMIAVLFSFFTKYHDFENHLKVVDLEDRSFPTSTVTGVRREDEILNMIISRHNEIEGSVCIGYHSRYKETNILSWKIIVLRETGEILYQS